MTRNEAVSPSNTIHTFLLAIIAGCLLAAVGMAGYAIHKAHQAVEAATQAYQRIKESTQSELQELRGLQARLVQLEDHLGGASQKADQLVSQHRDVLTSDGAKDLARQVGGKAFQAWRQRRHGSAPAPESADAPVPATQASE